MNYPTYVIHVKKGFEARERSIITQFYQLGLPFHWILEHDIADLSPDTLARYGYNGLALKPAEISCSLKHITAWERIAAADRGGLVFEDDVILDQNTFRPIKNSLNYRPIWG